MFGLISRRAHEIEVTHVESEMVCERKKNEALLDRIRLGEDYRARLEREISSTKAKNRELVHRVDAMQEEYEQIVGDLELRLDERNKRVRELELMLGSFEARWCSRTEKQEESA